MWLETQHREWHREHSWWRHQMEIYSALLAICAGNSPGTGEFPHKGQWCGALVFSLICVWINDWVNNREAGDLRRYRAHYVVTVMASKHCIGITARGFRWWKVNIGSGNDLVPSGNKPLPEPRLSKISDALWLAIRQWVNTKCVKVGTKLHQSDRRF